MASLEEDGPTRRWLAPAMAALAIVALIAVAPAFESHLDPIEQDQVLRMGIVALMAASLALVNGATGQFSLGHAAFQGVGAYTAAAAFALMFSDSSGVFPPSDPLGRHNPKLVALGARGAILLAGVVTALVGGIVARPCLRLRGDYLAIVTLGFNIIVGVIIRSLGKVGRIDLGGARGFEVPRGVARLAYNAGGFLDISLTLVVALFVLWRLVHRGRGLAFAAVRDDEIAAEAVGVNTTRTKVAAFVGSSFFAGMAGGLYAFKTGAIQDGTFDVAQSFDYVVMVILGGNGNILGAAIAGAGLTYLNDGLRDFQSWRPVVYSFALVWIMVARVPGLARKAFERARPARGGSPGLASDSSKPPAPISIPPLPKSDTPVLAVEGMTIRFGGLIAVDGLDLAIAPGECVGLIGPNGAGKSTVFNAIMGIYRPANGRVMVSGQKVGGVRPHRVVALGAARTFQNIRLFSGLSALENVRVAAWSRQSGGIASAFWPTARSRQAEADTFREARALLQAVGLSGLEDARATSLPYGAQRRLEIARALATGPRLLLLDEPAAGMNPTEKSELVGLLRSLHEAREMALLLIEHDLGLVCDLCPRIVVLDYGKAIAEGTPAEIRADPKVIEAYLGPELPPDGEDLP